MLDNRSHKDRVLEIYSREIGIKNQEINDCRNRADVCLTFKNKISEVLSAKETPWFYQQNREKKILELAALYHEKITPRFGLMEEEEKASYFGREMSVALKDLQEKTRQAQVSTKDWEELQKKFLNLEKSENVIKKTKEALLSELKISSKEIIGKGKDKDKDNAELLKILQRDFEKDESRKASGKEICYSNRFYFDINEIIKGQQEFQGLSSNQHFTKIVTAEEKRIKESDVETTEAITKAFKRRVDNGEITPKNFKEVFESIEETVKLKITLLLNQEVVSTEDASRGSSAQTPTVALGASVAEPPPSGGTDMETKEKAKTEKEIFEKKVTVGAEVAAIGGAALLGAVTIGTGGLFLPIAVGVGTVVAGAIAISEQEKIGKQTEAEKSESDNEIQKTIQKHVVDNPSKIVTKPAIAFGESVLNGTIWGEARK